MEKQEVVITVVGDGEVGKTCLIRSFMGEQNTGVYIPTVLEEVRKSDGVFELLIKDTAGQEQYSRLRTLAYPQTNVFIVCFALNHRTSFKNIKSVWYPELSHHRPDTPLILVGTKFDVENRNVSRAEALKLQKVIDAVFYLECSAKQGANINEVFSKAVTAYLKSGNKRRQRSHCNLF